MAKLKSTEVKVFPSAFRGLATGTKYNPEARLNTEFNVTNLTNRLASKDSFVISWNGTTSVVKFNIHGYYFELNLADFLSTGAGSNWTNVYARIRLLPFITDEGEPAAPNTKYKAFTLASVDDLTLPPSGKILDVTTSSIDTFFGVELSDSATPSLADTDYELPLLTRTAIPDTSPQEYTPWAVPLTSYLKFVATDVEGLPTINNSTTLKTNNTIFAPTTAGTAGQLSVSQGGTSALIPTWISTADVVVGEASQAVQLKSSRNIWGRPFNGTAAISGAISNTGNITPTETNTSNIGASDNVYANVYATTFTGNVTGDVSGNAGTVTNGIYTTSSSGQSITVSNGNGLEVRGGSSGNAYGLYGRAGAASRSIAVLANGQGSNTDSWGLAITRGAPNNTDDGLNSDHIRFRGTRNNIKFLSDGVTPNPSAASYIAIEPASLAASRKYTLPDAGTDADFVMTQGNQTIAGTKTFSNTISGNITGNAATVTANNYSFVFGNVYSPLFIENGPGNRTPMIDSRFKYDLFDGTLYAPKFSGSLSGNATTATAASTVTVNTTETAGNFKIPFANTAVSTTGNYQLLQDNTATFTYNPSTNVLVAGTFSGVGAYVKEATVDIWVQRIFTSSVLNPGGTWVTRYNAGTGNGLQVIANNVGADYVSGFYSPSDNDRFIFDVRVGTSNSVIKAVVYSQYGSSTSNENNSAIISFSTMSTSGHIVQYSFRWKVIIDNGVRFINLGGGTKITFK
jgi:hypothetical protein